MWYPSVSEDYIFLCSFRSLMSPWVPANNCFTIQCSGKRHLLIYKVSTTAVLLTKKFDNSCLFMVFLCLRTGERLKEKHMWRNIVPHWKQGQLNTRIMRIIIILQNRLIGKKIKKYLFDLLFFFSYYSTQSPSVSTLLFHRATSLSTPC